MQLAIWHQSYWWHTCLDRSSLHSEYRVINLRARSRASRNPSATNMISQISSKSGTTIAHGLHNTQSHWHIPTPLPWLPVLANIEPPALRRKAAVDKLLTKAASHEDWGLHGDITNTPALRLSTRHPLWLDMQPLDITTRWREDWESALVVNHFLVGDPAIRQPGFDLPRRQWCLLNRFRTAQGQCRACLKRWGQATSDLCDCGEIQTMSHIVEACPLTKFEGGLQALHGADGAAAKWLSRRWPMAYDKQQQLTHSAYKVHSTQSHWYMVHIKCTQSHWYTVHTTC